MVKNIIELSVNLIEATIIIDFLLRFFGSKYDNKRNLFGFWGMIIIFFTEISVMNYITPFEGLAVLVYVISITAYAFVFLKGGIPLKIMIGALIIAIDLLLAIGVNLIVSTIFNIDVINTITALSPARVILIVITKFLLFYITRIILKFKIDSHISIKDSVLLVIMPVITIVSMSSMMVTVMKHDDIKGEMLLSMVSVLFTNVMVYYLFIKISEDHKIKTEYKLLEQNYEAERKNIANMKALYRSIQELKHDLKNHLLLIQAFVKDHKLLEAEEYIKKLMNNNIEPVVQLVSIGNETFDAIINAKLSICKRDDVFVELNIAKDTLGFIDDQDICVLFGNLFDNAIEASVKSQSKYIQLKIQNQDSYLSIFMANSITSPVLKNNSNLITTKLGKEHHGYGVKNIRKVVEKYNGIIEYFEKDGELCCDILLEIV